MAKLTTLDWIIFSSLLLMSLLPAIWAQIQLKKTRRTQQYLQLILMGRRLTLPLFVAGLVATWYGGVIGVTDLTYHKGIYNFITQGIFWYLSYLIFALFLAKKIRRSQAHTMADLIRIEFGPKSAKLAGWLNLLNLIPISYTVAIGIFIAQIFNIEINLASLIGIILVLIYSARGGLAAIVYTDLFQMMIMFGAVSLVVFFSYHQFGGLSYLNENLPPTHFDPLGGESLSYTLVWAMIALSTLVDPNFYQRCLASQDEATAQKGIFIATFLWFIFDICTTLGGLYARSYFKKDNYNGAYLDYALEILPTGLRGLFLAGLAASILSSLDSYIFLAATTLVNDIFKKAKHQSMRNWHFLSCIIIGLISVVLASFFEGNIVAVWRVLGSLSSSTLLIPFIMGKFVFRLNDQEFFKTSLSSIASIIIYVVVIKLYPTFLNIDFFYIGVISGIISLIYFKIKKVIKSDS